MSERLPDRRDLPAAMTWNLTGLFADDATWEAAFAQLDGADAAVQALRGKLKTSAKRLAAAILGRDALARRLNALHTYAHLRADEDLGDATHQAMQDRIRSRYTAFMAGLAWIEPEILAIPQARLDALAAAPAMAPCRRVLHEIVRYRPHTLSANEERLLSLAAEPLATPQKTFSLLTNADLRFPVIQGDAGADVELTQGNYLRFMESRQRPVRQAAFEALYDTFGKVRNTLATTLDGHVRKQVFNAKVRNQPSALRNALFGDNVDQAVYDGLIAAVHERLPAFYGYMDLRRRRLGLEQLDMYDMYVPIVPKFNLEVPWAQGCAWVQEALRPLGAEYGALLSRAFSERWIDVLECRGKRSGAYSSGCFDSNPFILMNYQGNLNGVFTLAHELGHSLHSAHSNMTQPHLTADYTIFVAEVASITNEALLFHHLVSTARDPKLLAFLYNHQCEAFRGTVYRQTMFAEFEKQIHAMVEGGGALTADSLSEAYYALNGQFFGPQVVADKRINMEWARIPHFYYNFYVYKYATGFAAAQIFAQKILRQEPGAVEKYLGFLRAGSSQDPLDILATAGVDLRQPSVVASALDDFAATVQQFDQMLQACE